MENQAEIFANLERFKTVIEICAVFVTMVIGIGTVWWKLARMHAAMMIGLDNVETQVSDLVKTQKALTNSVVETRTKTTRQSEDVRKMEAQLEIHRKDFHGLALQFAQTAKDFERVYRALQKAGIVSKHDF